MKVVKRLLCTISIFVFGLLTCSCSGNSSDYQNSSGKADKPKKSTFSIVFLDVGQGDSALVECDGHYMLIDGGDTSSQDKVYQTLVDKEIQHLDILVMSHLHKDHIGGLERALAYTSSIDLTISNSDDSDSPTFRKVKHQLDINKAKIIVPENGTKYLLGSAEIEVVDVSNEEENDSLVLLITYGENKFLFTGDAETNQQYRIINKYKEKPDSLYKIDLIKMPHHGSSGDSLIDYPIASLLYIFMPDYAIISVGEGNPYKHPHEKTLQALSDARTKVYRTDKNGDITVKSDGKSIQVTSSK